MSAARSNMKQAVLATLCSNRVGIVSEVTSFLEEHRANLLATYTSRLGNLYGEFFQFEASQSEMKAIRTSYKRRLKEFRPRMYATNAVKVPPDDFAHVLTIYSFDRPGIVSKAAALLKNTGVDIRHIAGAQYPVQETGSPLFIVEMKLDLPDSLSEDALLARLSEMADENGWDFDFEPVSPGTKPTKKEPVSVPPSKERRPGTLRVVASKPAVDPEPQLLGLA
jgi:glycine cleavage system transcriptional repressor